jgi:asparagine synthase (glutamine-hydrolysing)
MCGIAGLLHPQPRPVDAASRTVDRMLDAMAHRGPDGQGIWSPDDTAAARVVLGHRRLAIIDPDHGRQPMSNETGDIAVTFNGCIYNYRELRDQLAAAGHRFATACDTEVIVHAYEQWGVEAIERFNGMFAFALWDGPRQKLVLCRDRIGIKPLYYHHADDGTLAFASEPKALLAGGFADAAVDPDGLRQYLTLQLSLGQCTMFRGIHRLAPAHVAVVQPGGPVQPRPYWSLRFEPPDEAPRVGPGDPASLDAADDWYTGRLRELLNDSVRLRLRSDVPLGAHLSGGLDSSTIVSLARGQLSDGAPLATFTGAFDAGAAFDETPHAKAVAEACGTTYHETFLTAHDFAEQVPGLIEQMDYPVAGPGVFPQHMVCRLAAQHVKVTLGGQGGDELFVGYARHLIAQLEQALAAGVDRTADAQGGPALSDLAQALPTLRRYRPMMRYFFRDGLFDEPARRYFRLMDRSEGAIGLLSENGRSVVDAEATYSDFLDLYDAPGARGMLDQMFAFDVRAHLPALLHVEDRTSMASGLESRVPLLDHRIVELVAGCPPAVRFRGGELKHLLVGAVRDVVPRPVLQRTDKMGFPVPLNDWLRGPLGGFVQDVLLDRTARQRGLFDIAAVERAVRDSGAFSRALWGVLCVELWHRAYVDG